MRHPETWKPSKYVLRRGRLRASRDAREVRVGSRLVADRTAAWYDRMLPLHARGRLLDLGCGKAPLHATYAPHIRMSVGADWPQSLHANPHLDLACNLARPLPFASGSFDTIVCSDVLEHVPDPFLAWTEIHRVLAPGGHVLINVPFYHCLHEQPHDYFRYTSHALRHFVAHAGLELVSLETTGGSPEILADFCATHLQKVPLVGPAIAAVLQALAALLTARGPGRRLSRFTADTFPLGYALVARRSPTIAMPP